MIKEFKSVVKSFQQRKSQDLLALLVNPTKYLKKN